MTKYFKNPWVVAAALMSSLAVGGAIKNWVTGEVITAAQLNGALNHIHSNMVGGHGARLVNSDVASNAALSSTKLADGTMIPWAKVTVGTWESVCSSGSCSAYLKGARNVVLVNHVGTGEYRVYFSTAIPQPMTVLCTATYAKRNCSPSVERSDGGSLDYIAVWTDDTENTAVDAPFSLVVWNDGAP